MHKIREFAAILFLGGLFSLFSPSAAAQSYYEELPRTFYGGLVAGANFTQVDGDRFAGYHKLGMNIGGIVYTQFAPNLAVSLEILYSQKGSRAHKAQLSTSQAYLVQSHRIKLDYAEVPVMLCYFDKRKSHFGLGFSYSQLIQNREDVQTNPSFPVALLEEEYPFRKMDLNFLVGGSLKLYKGLFLNLRFQYSMIPIRTKVHPELGRQEQFSNLYALRLMYLF